MKHLRIAEEVALGVSQYHENIMRKKRYGIFYFKNRQNICKFFQKFTTFLLIFCVLFNGAFQKPPLPTRKA